MKAIKTQTLPAGAGVLQCPSGHRLRLLLITCAVTTGGTDQVSCSVACNNQTALQASSGGLGAGVSKFSFGIGLPSNDTVIDNIDPVTGVVSLSSTQDHATGALPNVWWPNDITLSVGLVAGTLQTALAMFELVPEA